MRTASALLLAALPLVAQEKPKEPPKKEPPALLVATPLGVPAGAVTRVVVRGLRLDRAAEVRIADGGGAGAAVKILEKGPAPPPNGLAPARAGDTRAVLEVAVPDAAARGAISIVFTSPDGASKPLAILIDTPGEVIAEKEPNGGFAAAQEVPMGSRIEGTIERPQDVDVFRFEGKAGDQVRIETLADRCGSVLDSIITVYDASGHEVASADDGAEGLDAAVEVKLPASGTYYAVLLDAFDQGGPAHPYRLFLSRVVLRAF